MPPRDPFTFQQDNHRLPTLKATLKRAEKHPFLGVTQGGSSRKDRGARVAATTAKFHPTKKQEKKLGQD